MKITITGDLGSGKTTTSKNISKKLNLKRLGVGDFMREISLKRNLTLLELNKLAETDPTIDKELDKRQLEFGKQNDDFILDARLGWHFIPDSLKIYLKVDLDESTKRIFKDSRDIEVENNSLEITKKNILKRKESEKKRYKEYYNLDYDAKENFDLIIDTTSKKSEEVTNLIINYSKREKK